MKNIYIFRHGETDWNAIDKLQGRNDIELNENGIQQAQNISKHIKDINFDRIFSSPLKRALKTAKTVANDLNIENIILENDLIECNFGDAEGVIKKDINSIFGKNFGENFYSGDIQYDDLKFPNGESKKELRDRITNCINKIVLNNLDLDNYLLSSHGFAIKQLIIATGSEDYSGLKNCEIVHFQFDIEKYYKNEEYLYFIERIKTN